jgi:hypothetical protein
MSVFQDVYGINKEDPEQYFKHMSAVANYKNIKLQKNTKWGSVLDRTDMGTRFLAGAMSNIEEKDNEEPKSPKKLAPLISGKALGAKQKTSDSQSTTNDNAAPPSSILGRLRRGTVSSISDEETEVTKPPKPGILGKLKGVPEAPPLDEVNDRAIRTPAKPAFRPKLLSSTKDQNIEQADDTTKKDQTEKEKHEDKEQENKDIVLKLPAINKKKDLVTKTEEPEVTENPLELKENKPGAKYKAFFQTPTTKTITSLSSLKLDKHKTSTVSHEGLRSPTHTEKSSATTIERKARKRKRLTSALLISQAKATDGAVPLPLISTENMSRPFFYWNGLREEDYVMPFLDQVTKHKGANSRERAIKSLTIANSFKEKPWLAQVRMAMSLTSQSLRRTMTDCNEDS